MISEAVSQMKSGRFATMDVKSMLGDVLYTLAETMNINMTEDVLGAPNVQSDLQLIMQKGFKDVMTDIQTLETESLRLYAKLESLKEELKAETEQFEEQKEVYRHPLAVIIHLLIALMSIG
jgi:hypothetical protein